MNCYEDAASDTPMLRQYKAIKRNHQDAILFFRLGDFYEMFLDDATTAAKELSLTLTGRGKEEQRIPMCGIPYHAIDNYLPKLIKKGYKVAICEQVEDPALSTGITKRDVVRIVTPGTVLDQTTLDASKNNYLMALQSLPKTQGYAGSYVDISTGEFMLFLAKTRLECQAIMAQCDPKEILQSEDTTIDISDDVLVNSVTMTIAERAHTELCQHFQIQSLRAFGCEGYEATYPSALALLNYIKTTQKQSLPQLTTLKAYRCSETLFMDTVTQKNLELTDTLHTTDTQGSLFALLNHCKTSPGSRLLRRWIQAPLTNTAAINHRLEAISALKTDLLSREEIRETLARVYDIERLMARIVSERHNPRDLIALKLSLQALQDLPAILTHLNSPLLNEKSHFFDQFHDASSPYQRLINTIQNSLLDEPPAVIRDGHLFKDGYHHELDALKASFKSIRSWIGSLEQVERDATQIKSLKVGFNKVFGYYFEIPHSQSEKVPAHYIRKQTLTNAERYITPELKEKETILLNGEDKQKELEISLYKALIASIEVDIPNLKVCATHTAELDTLQALSTAAQKYRYTRPGFIDKDHVSLHIKAGRHPVLEQRQDCHFIPNDIQLERDKNRFLLITGPNMAGKSTLMRQVALITIMAQMGSFVPAESCTLAPVDKLFTRIGAMDNLYSGQSTFMVEMLETATILNNATPYSLIILDEIGRGTSTYDGMSIAGAITHYIHHHIGARTLFATHYHELTELSKVLPALQNASMAIKETATAIAFTYTLIHEPADKSYGVHVAKMAGLPEPVIKKAEDLLAHFETQTEANPEQKPTLQLSLF